MLLGTTYAWFTDSVTSAGNIIKTGTLDVTLEYKKVGETDWSDASKGSIFNYQLWEPGYTEVRYVKIENEGSLDLKFELNIIPTQTPAAGEVNLADVIDVYMMKGEATVTRDALAAATPVGTLASLMADEDGAAYGVLFDKKEGEADTTDDKNNVEVYTIVLKMKENAGNEYQEKSIGGSFVVQLVATQLANESDDLDADYDADATYPTVTKVKIPAGTTVPTTLPAGDAAVIIPAGAPAGEYEFAISNENVETDDQGNTTASFDLELKVDGQKATGSYSVEKFIGKNLNITEVTHNGEVIAVDNYDPTTGIVTFTANGFSPFTVTYYSGEINAVEDLANLNKGGNFVLAADIDLAGTSLVIPANKVVNLDLNGKVINGTVGRDADNNRIHVIVNNGILTIKDGTVKSAGNDGGSAIYNNEGATLTIEDVTLYGAPQSDPVYEAGVSKPYPSYAVNNYGNAVVNGATVKSYHGAIATGGNGVTVINDADIDVGLGQSTGITSYLIYSYDNAQVTVNDGKFAFTKQEIYVNGGNTFCELGTNPIIINGGNYTGTSFSTGEGREYVIKGGTFDADPSAYVADGFMAVAAGSSYMVVPNTYVKVADGLYRDPENAVKYYVFTAAGLEAINGMMADKTAGRDTVVEIMADIDFAGKTWVTVDSHADTAFEIAEINGNGHTIYNLTINGQAMFRRFAGSGDVVIKDITFDGAVVNSTSLNTSILTGQTYQNVLLDNVDVKNSSITGAYKVAPLIATVYNESATTITATLKNCDVSDTTVTSTRFDFFTCGLVSFVYTTDNDCVEYENCSITNVALKAVSGGYNYHANIHYTSDDTDDQINEHPGVVVTNVTFERIG